MAGRKCLHLPELARAGLADGIRLEPSAQRQDHAGALARHAVDLAQVDDRTAVDLGELLRIELPNQHLQGRANQRFACYRTVSGEKYVGWVVWAFPMPGSQRTGALECAAGDLPMNCMLGKWIVRRR